MRLFSFCDSPKNGVVSFDEVTGEITGFYMVNLLIKHSNYTVTLG